MITAQRNHFSTYARYLKLIHATREFLRIRKYLELMLPTLSPELIPESYVEVFETEYQYFDVRRKLYLTPSPELFVKRLLVEGIGNCYYLGKSYRNSEPQSSRHNGEFTMLEWYKVPATYLDLADEVLALLQHIHTSLFLPHTSTESAISSSFSLVYQGIIVDLSCWEKLTVAEAFDRYAAITPDQLFDHEYFKKRCVEKGYQVERTASNALHAEKNHTFLNLESQSSNSTFTYEELWSQVYATEIEPHLGTHGHPTLLYDYPVEFAALSKPNTDGKTAQRFEFYIAGIELGNCYSELTNWQLQEKRLHDEAALRAASNKIPHPIDTGFIDALKSGLPDCAGIAIGMERLGMIFTNSSHINDLQLITWDP